MHRSSARFQAHLADAGQAGEAVEVDVLVFVRPGGIADTELKQLRPVPCRKIKERQPFGVVRQGPDVATVRRTAQVIRACQG